MWGVLRDHRLVREILVPRDVTGVVVVEQDVPLLDGLAMPVRLSRAPIDDDRTVGRASEHVRAGPQPTAHGSGRPPLPGSAPAHLALRARRTVEGSRRRSRARARADAISLRAGAARWPSG